LLPFAVSQFQRLKGEVMGDFIHFHILISNFGGDSEWCKTKLCLRASELRHFITWVVLIIY
jgi:hypothetical protein